MSKFFKALEHAERERAASSAAKVTADGSSGTVATAVPPGDHAATATVTSPPPPDPAPVRAPVEHRAPLYGAPVARHAQATHEGVFPALLEPPSTSPPGEVEDHLVSLLEPTSAAAEQYRNVRLAIENFRRERGTRLVGVASPGRGEGKTTTAINLAGSLAQGYEVRVALVEADLRYPSMAKTLGLQGGRGLSSYLMDSSLEIDQVVQRPAGLGFAVLVAGAVSSMPYELLKSPRLSALFAALRANFDFVVVDTPPALAFPDVGILRDLVDGFVMVIRANRTPRERVRETINAIGTQRVLGMIFNDDGRTNGAGDEPRRGRLRTYLDRPRGGARDS